MALLNANSNPAYIGIQAFLGVADESHETAIDFESSSLTGAVVAKSPPIIIPATGSTSISLTTYFANCAAPVFFVVYDITTSPGQSFGFSTSGGNYMMVGAASWGGWAADGISALPATLYLTNPNANPGTVICACITN